ncbi:hypothetical protein [Vulcaniibacterium tengchongense]|uniref:Uncharacterized protein n=1 Tax=Vulcaniibacterium tengchongense TaxID=1273429 RepID=A0A3N4UXM2_9GAMM|nr:hypothetical protein [Vulcaniibacterium tengchongense]RPE75496.1 hypothetical protein EDC50_2941 [Vulcaniibacterium tengchongense]
MRKLFSNAVLSVAVAGAPLAADAAAGGVIQFHGAVLEPTLPSDPGLDPRTARVPLRTHAGRLSDLHDRSEPGIALLDYYHAHRHAQGLCDVPYVTATYL